MQTLPANVAAHIASSATWPIRLFEIGGTPTLYFCDSDKAVSYDGITWLPKGISYSQAKLSRSVELDTYKVSVDNIDESLISWALANDPTGATVKVYKGFASGSTNASGHLLLIDNFALVLFSGRIASIKADDVMEFDVKSGVDLHNQRGPRTLQMKTCRFQGIDGFKGVNCGYAGAETECNYTFSRCRELGNEARFGGFPDITEKRNS